MRQPACFRPVCTGQDRINPGIFADYDELSEAVRTAILNSLPATANNCAEIEKMEPGQLLTLLVLISEEMRGEAVNTSFNYSAISNIRGTKLLVDDQLMAAMGLNLKRSKEGAHEDQLAELMASR